MSIVVLPDFGYDHWSYMAYAMANTLGGILNTKSFNLEGASKAACRHALYFIEQALEGGKNYIQLYSEIAWGTFCVA